MKESLILIFYIAVGTLALLDLRLSVLTIFASIQELLIIVVMIRKYVVVTSGYIFCTDIQGYCFSKLTFNGASGLIIKLIKVNLLLKIEVKDKTYKNEQFKEIITMHS